MDSKIKPRLLELLAEHPLGLTTPDAQTLLEVSQNGVSRAARTLAAEGRIALMKSSHHVVMSLPEHAPATRMRLRAECEAKANAEKLRKAEWYRQRDQLRRQWYAPVLCDAESPVQRRVPAVQMKPLRKIGPASVFELGAK